MKILLKPQVSDRRISYSFEGEVITARMGDTVDSFDFSGLPDGRLQLHDEEGQPAITTDLPVMPIEAAWREDGQLHVQLLNFIGTDATEAEKWPEWQEVGKGGQD